VTEGLIKECALKNQKNPWFVIPPLCIIPRSTKQVSPMQEIITFMQQHWTLSVALAIVLVLLIIVELLKQKSSGGLYLSSARVTHFINHQNAIIVDLRNAEAFASGHIVGAISLPMDEIKDKLKKIEKFKSQPIILVCATGGDSQRTAPILLKNGYLVHILTGGLKTWKMDQLPLVKQ